MIVVSTKDWRKALEELKAVLRHDEKDELHYISELDGQEVCYHRPMLVGETHEPINKTFE